MKIRNATVADKIGFSESGVSLIRNGKRFPLLCTMEKIEEAYDWKVNDQFAARSDYAGAFETVLQDYYTEHGLQ